MGALEFQNMGVIEGFSAPDDLVYGKSLLVLNKDKIRAMASRFNYVNKYSMNVINRLNSIAGKEIFAETREFTESGDKLGYDFHANKNFVNYKNNKDYYRIFLNQYLLNQILKTKRIGKEDEAAIRDLDVENPKLIYELDKIIGLKDHETKSMISFINKLDLRMHALNVTIEKGNNQIYGEYSNSFNSEYDKHTKNLAIDILEEEQIIYLKDLMEKNSGESELRTKNIYEFIKDMHGRDPGDKKLFAIKEKLEFSSVTKDIPMANNFSNSYNSLKDMDEFLALHKSAQKKSKETTLRILGNKTSASALFYSTNSDGNKDERNLNSRIYGALEFIYPDYSKARLAEITKEIISKINSSDFQDALEKIKTQDAKDRNPEASLKFHKVNTVLSSALSDLLYNAIIENELQNKKDENGKLPLSYTFKTEIDIVKQLNDNRYDIREKVVENGQTIKDESNNILNIMRLLEMVDNDEISKKAALEITDSGAFVDLEKDALGLKEFIETGFKHKEYDSYATRFVMDDKSSLEIQDELKMRDAKEIFESNLRRSSVLGVTKFNKIMKNLATCINDASNSNTERSMSTSSMVTSCLDNFQRDLEQAISESGNALSSTEGVVAFTGIGLITLLNHSHNLAMHRDYLDQRHIMESEIERKMSFIKESENDIQNFSRDAIIRATNSKENSKENNGIEVIINEDTLDIFEEKITLEEMNFYLHSNEYYIDKDHIGNYTKNKDLAKTIDDSEMELHKIEREISELRKKIIVDFNMDKDLDIDSSIDKMNKINEEKLKVWKDGGFEEKEELIKLKNNVKFINEKISKIILRLRDQSLTPLEAGMLGKSLQSVREQYRSTSLATKLRVYKKTQNVKLPKTLDSIKFATKSSRLQAIIYMDDWFNRNKENNDIANTQKKINILLNDNLMGISSSKIGLKDKLSSIYLKELYSDLSEKSRVSVDELSRLKEIIEKEEKYNSIGIKGFVKNDDMMDIYENLSKEDKEILIRESSVKVVAKKNKNGKTVVGVHSDSYGIKKDELELKSGSISRTSSEKISRDEPSRGNYM